MVVFLLMSLVSIGVPAFAGQAGQALPSISPSVSVTAGLPFLSIATATSRHPSGAFKPSEAVDGRARIVERHFDLSQPRTADGEGSGRWCVAGLALVAAGVTAAVVSGVRSSGNPQSPSPPVGVVLGTATGVVGGIQMIRSCRR